MVKISIFTVTLNVIAGFIFIPKYGIIAASLISTISYTMYSILLSRKFMISTNQNILNQYLFNKSEIFIIKDYIDKFKSNT
jgi:O-antigen/teichoic acid export membrane protein